MKNRSLFCPLLLLSSASLVIATDYTWSNAAGTFSWADAANWSPEGVPGAGDNVTFNANTAGDTIAMDGDRTVNNITFGGNVRTMTIGSPADTLTVAGAFNGGYMGTACTITIAAKLHLVKDTQVASYGPYGKQIVFASEIFDDGLGFGIFTPNDQNQGATLLGANTYSGPTVLQGYSHSLGGPNGAIPFSPLIFNGLSSSIAIMTVDNSADANPDRLSNTLPVTFRRCTSKLQLNGHTTDAITEKIGGLTVESGAHTIQLANKGADVTLEVDGPILRSGAGAFIVEGANTTTARFVVDGAADNGHGIYRPWIVLGGWNPAHSTIDANGALKGASYAAFPTTDAAASPDVLYSHTGDLTLSRDQSVYGFRFYGTSAATLDLGSHDLRIGDGGFCYAYAQPKTVTSSAGGALVFTGPEVVFFGAGNGWPYTGDFLLDAPLDCESETPPALCMPYIISTKQVRFLGEDRIGTYSNVLVNFTANGYPFELGGPSDRTFLGVYSGTHKLVKTGPGTLTLACENVRGPNATSIEAGKVVVAHPLALNYGTYDAKQVTITNATLEIASGIVVPDFLASFLAGSTLTGGGDIVTRTTIPFGTGATIAPGNGVGILTIDRVLFAADSTYEWELGDGTDVPGVDYDLLRFPRNYWGGFKFNGNPKVKLAVKAAGSGWERVKGKTFTIVEWTGGGDISAPSEVEIVNLSPRRLITDNAVVTFDTAAKKVYLSGLLAAPTGTTVLVR